MKHTLFFLDEAKFKDNFFTKVINKHSKEPYDIYIGRGSKWGNPFEMKSTNEKERERVVEEYIDYFWKTNLVKDLPELYGKVLACYCKPKKCHGDFLSFLCNNRITNKEMYDAYINMERLEG